MDAEEVIRMLAASEAACHARIDKSHAESRAEIAALRQEFAKREKIGGGLFLGALILLFAIPALNGGYGPRVAALVEDGARSYADLPQGLVEAVAPDTALIDALVGVLAALPPCTDPNSQPEFGYRCRVSLAWTERELGLQNPGARFPRISRADIDLAQRVLDAAHDAVRSEALGR